MLTYTPRRTKFQAVGSVCTKELYKRGFGRIYIFHHPREGTFRLMNVIDRSREREREREREERVLRISRELRALTLYLGIIISSTRRWEGSEEASSPSHGLLSIRALYLISRAGARESAQIARDC